MDGKETIVTSGLSSYFFQHRNIGGSSPISHSGLHGDHSGIRGIPTSSSGLQSAQDGGGPMGSTFLAEASSTMAQHDMNASGVAGMGQGESVKRKRGRPRKYGPEGNMSLGLSPLSPTPPMPGLGLVSGAASISVSRSAGSAEKPRRGRPPGTGRKQLLASLGEWFAGSAGTGFTPHIITVPSGEDVAAKIMSFTNQGPRAVCILSAYGAVSRVTLHQSSTSGELVTYQGLFEILCLSGSFLLSEEGGSRARSGGLTISLSGPDGRVIGGALGGVLIAAGNVQVITGSFVYGGSKAKNKNKTSEEPGVGSGLHLDGDQDRSISPSPHQSLTLASAGGGWPGSRVVDMIRSTNIDINSTRG